MVKVDRTPPPRPVITAVANSDNSVSVQWSCSDPESSVYQYSYGVGTSAGSDDVFSWTTCKDIAVLLAGLGSGSRFIAVRAQNAFGYWSEAAVAEVAVAGDTKAHDLPDGTLVRVAGKVTAVFADCCYLQQPDRLQGLKVVGQADSVSEGDDICVQGSLHTTNGERLLLVH